MNGDPLCVAYADHLRAEHRELHQHLRGLQKELKQVTTRRVDGPLLARLTDAVRQIRDELTHHFAEEDSGGCLDYAVSLMPRLAPEAQALEHEHPSLLREINDLFGELLVARPGELKVAAVRARCDTFIARMLAHEMRENSLVERGFNISPEE